MNRFHTLILAGALMGLPLAASAQDQDDAAAKPKPAAKTHKKPAAKAADADDSKAPLKLVASIPLPDLKDGDFDHLAIDLEGKRLFVTAEENGKIEIFDTENNKLIHTIDGLKAPHSMLYRGDLKKLFVVDSDLGEVKVYDTTNYNLVDSIKVREGADSAGYDPSTKYLWVVDGGKDAKMPGYLDIIDTTAGKKVGEMKMDNDDIEAMAFDPASSRIFIDIRGAGTVEVLDKDKHTVIATWPVPAAKGSLTTLSFDAANHRLYVGGRTPAKLYVLDSDTGKVVTSVAAAPMVDDAAFSAAQKRIYFAGNMYTDVFEIKDADHLERIGHVPTAFRAKTALVVPELNRFYVAVPHHAGKSAEIRVYETVL